MSSELEVIAARIRRWRDDANFTLQELADRAGVSASTVHKVENNQTVPTLTVFLKIAHGLGRSPGDLLASEAEADRVAFTRERDRMTLGDREGTRVQRIVESLSDPQIEMWRTVLQPGVGSDATLIQDDGELIILCEEGELSIWAENQEFKMTPGDALHLKASIPRRWLNTGSGPAAALVAMNMPARSRRDSEERIRDIIRTGGGDPGDTDP